MRTIEEILANPKLGETLPSRALGYRGYKRRIWFACTSCGKPRWIIDVAKERNKLYCRQCHLSLVNRKKYRPDAIGVFKTIRGTDTPKVGDLIRGDELGRGKYRIHKWIPCPDCGRCRWVRWTINNNCDKRLCTDCIKKSEYKARGEKSGMWRGGRSIHPSGYVFVRVSPDSSYYPMATRGHVQEHRLVMAQYLGRCLEPWEIVHHKHTKFPFGSAEDKQDNRIENLELIPVAHTHNTITILENRVHQLETQVAELTTMVRLCKWQIRELTTQNTAPPTRKVQ